MKFTKKQARDEVIVKGLRLWQSQIKASMCHTGNPAERADTMENFNTAVKTFGLQVRFGLYDEAEIARLRDNARNWYKGK